MTKRAILLDRRKSIRIFEKIKKGRYFNISLKSQEIENGDIVYLCSYLERDYPDENRRNSLLSIVKCRVVSYELTRDKKECIYSTNTSEMKIELEYMWDRKRRELIFEFVTGYIFATLTTVKRNQYENLEFIFGLDRVDEEI